MPKYSQLNDLGDGGQTNERGGKLVEMFRITTPFPSKIAGLSSGTDLYTAFLSNEMTAKRGGRGRRQNEDPQVPAKF